MFVEIDAPKEEEIDKIRDESPTEDKKTVFEIMENIGLPPDFIALAKAFNLLKNMTKVTAVTEAKEYTDAQILGPIANLETKLNNVSRKIAITATKTEVEILQSQLNNMKSLLFGAKLSISFDKDTESIKEDEDKEKDEEKE